MQKTQLQDLVSANNYNSNNFTRGGFKIASCFCLLRHGGLDPPSHCWTYFDIQRFAIAE